MPGFNRRGFLRQTLGVSWTSAALLQQSVFRAAAARAQSVGPQPRLFEIRKAADGVYLAQAKPAVLLNCNAAIFENTADLLVVDTHSKPSAVAALVAQIRKEITPKPVRYVVNSHFHWDHSQGNAGYRKLAPHADLISSEVTRRLLSQEAAPRVRESLEATAKSLEESKQKLASAKTAEEKQYLQQMVAESQAFLREMKDYQPDLPNVTLTRDLIIRDKAHTLHLAFRGRGHTAGDVVVWCPEKRAIAGGDLLHGWSPYIGDGYPRDWPATLIGVAEFDFDHILGGHGPLQKRERLYRMRDYIEELTWAVENGKRAGKSVDVLQAQIVPEKLKSLAGGYGVELGTAQRQGYYVAPGTTAETMIANSVRSNIADIFKNLDRN